MNLFTCGGRRAAQLAHLEKTPLLICCTAVCGVREARRRLYVVVTSRLTSLLRDASRLACGNNASALCDVMLRVFLTGSSLDTSVQSVLYSLHVKFAEFPLPFRL